jgi:hypothetical protein
MSGSDRNQQLDLSQSTPHRRDWILLLALGLLTMVALVGATEFVARWKFKDAETELAPCLVLNDDSTGVRGVPNSRCMAKGSESSWAEYRFNSRGHRADEYKPKAPGSYRIVLTGSSIAMGLYVPTDRSIAGLLPGELSQATGHKVELYNTAIGAAYGGTPHSIDLRFQEILAAQPDMILWIITPWDVDHASGLRPESDFLKTPKSGLRDSTEPNSLRASKVHRFAAKIGASSTFDSLFQDLKSFRLRVLLTHYLYKSRSLYLKSYLMNADDKIGFLRSDWSPEWKDNLGQFDYFADRISARAHEAGVPLVAVLIPNRAQAIMISAGEWPAGFDPYRIDDELHSSFTRHGATYVDIFPAFRTIADPENNYMPVDGHPYEEGHAMLARMITQQLTAGAVPALKPAAKPNPPLTAVK